MPGYDEMCSFQNLYNAHKAARRGKRDKTEVIKFEMNLAENLCNLQKELTGRMYTPRGYKHFMIYEPKARSIYAPDYADRVVQHCLCDNVLMPTLERRLIYDNAACRTDKGTHFSMDRLSGFMRRFFRAHGTDGYFLKCDVRKYFDSINHSVLKQKLSKVFDGEVFTLLCRIIDSYETTKDVGLPLGNQASQWFALYYLDGVDRLIKERLQIKYYVRYMDDFVLIHNDKNHLRYCLSEIDRVCGAELKIELNEKTQIFPVKNGVDYLGWHFYLTETGKVIRKLRTSNKRRLKRRMKKKAQDYHDHALDVDDIKRSLASTNGHLSHGHTYRLRKKLAWKTVYTHGDWRIYNQIIKGDMFMASKRIETLINNIREITVADEYAMDFYSGATEEEILAFEQTNHISFPRLVRDWLRFADGSCLFDTLVMFYGVAHGKRIAVQNDGFICIGMFNYGDTICIKSGSKTIYLCGETIIEYDNFSELLSLVIAIGTGDSANE